MTDAELYFFCQRYRVSLNPHGNLLCVLIHHSPSQSVNHHIIDIEHFMDVAKVKALKKVLKDSEKENKRVLLFSQVSLKQSGVFSCLDCLPDEQFTQMLDVLQVILAHLGIRYIRLDGSTKVDERQSLVDDFTNDSDIKVFLLSTKAGGMG